MIIAGIDTETTGLQRPGGPTIEIVEVGYTIYSTDHELVLSQGSEIFSTDEWGEEAEGIHHIPRSATEIANIRPKDIKLYERFKRYGVEVVIAHNAPSDYPLVVKAWPKFKNIKWICSRADLNHEKFCVPYVASRRLMHLSVDYGIYKPGWHRALGDSEMCTLIAAKHDLASILAGRMEQTYLITTGGSWNAGAKDHLSSVGFRWDSDKKHWWKDGVTKDKVSTIKKLVKKIAPDWRFETVEQEQHPYMKAGF